MAINPGEIVASPEFSAFLIDAKSNHGYGSPDAQVVTALGGAKELSHEASPFLYVDHWVGGNRYGGHEIVSVETTGHIRHKPVWNMSYYETLLEGINWRQLGAIMRTVLPQPDPELPLRGPKNWEGGIEEVGNVVYEVRGLAPRPSLEFFHVQEMAFVDGRRVYAARFMGGLVNDLD